MPTRDIKESILTSKTLAQLSHGAERCFFRITVLADDFGRFEADPELIRSRCFARMLDKVKLAHIEDWLEEMVSVDLIRLYEADTPKSPLRMYGYFPTWLTHQRQRAKWSKYPAPPSIDSQRHHEVSNNGHLHSLPADDGKRQQMPADVAVVTEEPDTPETPVEPEAPLTPHAAPPLVRANRLDGFEEFWAAWPHDKRVNRKEAVYQWRKLAPSPSLRQEILAAVEAAKLGREWQKEGGQYIPHPHRWLKKSRWEDARPAAQGSLLTAKTDGNAHAAAAFLRRMGAT